MKTVILCSLICSTSILHAADWPRWRGPDLNGISKETEWSAKFPDGEPKIVWKAKVGTGFSSVSVAARRLFTIGNTGGTETVWCFDAATGKEVWKHEYVCPLDPKYFEGGPTSTPTVDGDVVYTLSRRGHVYAFEAATGKVRWSNNLAEENGMPMPTWGFSGSPLVQGKLLVLNIGDAGMAVDKTTGKVIWKSATEEAGYSTAMPIKRGERSFLIFGCKKSWRAVDSGSGEEVWSHRWLTRYGVNAADPIISGDHILVSSGYGKGAALLKWANENEEPEVVWKNKDLRSQMAPAVLVDGHLFGTDGDAGNKNALKCLDFATGEVKWSESNIGTGGVIAADGKLIVLSSRGELIVAPASSEKFEPIARAQVLGGKCWTVPVLANARVYCRNAAGDLICVDVSK
jgi:outer membrane protein assembly factor BamB